MENTIDVINERLKTYCGAHENEKWKLETDLNKCTQREKLELVKYGLTIDDLMRMGFNRGQVSHFLFGYRFSGKRR